MAKRTTEKTLIDIVAECVKSKPDQNLSRPDIAQMIIEKHPNRKEIKEGADMIAQYGSEMSRDREKFKAKYPEIKINNIGGKAIYRYNTKEDLAEYDTLADDFASNDKEKIIEIELYPLLIEYLSVEFNVHGLRINESKGRNIKKGTNIWRYPDVVGVENLAKEWHSDIQKLATNAGEKRVQFWSFEVKNFISPQTIRQKFFQAVSNSSWANFAYLVTVEIENEEETLKELRRLSSLHGVGVIQLDKEDHLNKSRIIIPARERADIDLGSASELAKASQEFAKFIDDAADICLNFKDPKF